MKQTLSTQNLLGMGFMMFSMFLGAGNLIFPPMAGYMAGEELWLTILGFLITGVGLPLLGVIVIAKVGGGFNELAQELPRKAMVALGTFIYLIVGPLYAVPRTGLVSYEMAVVPFVEGATWVHLVVFSLVFFSVTWGFCMRPGKLLDSLGKVVTPALIILLLILGLAPVFSPLADFEPGRSPYLEAPFIRGFLDGYLTMDAIASLLFGIVIITNLKSHGIESRSALFKYSIYTGIIAALGLGLVYTSLFYLGGTSGAMLNNPENGADILIWYTDYRFGGVGKVLLASVVLLACLTTAVGCVTATAEYFDGLLPSVGYAKWVTMICVSCVLFANIGLNEIITLFGPVLMVLYPVCIVMIALGLVHEWLPNPKLVYRITLGVVLLVSALDEVRGGSTTGVWELFSALPGFAHDMLWAVPTVAAFVLSVLMGSKRASI